MEIYKLFKCTSEAQHARYQNYQKFFRDWKYFVKKSHNAQIN